MSGSIAERLKALGLTLPAAPPALANYVPFVLAGDTLYVSGQISRTPEGAVIAGQLGVSLTVEQGQAAARTCALAILAQAAAALGSLERIAHVARLNGFVNAAPGFADHPKVVNGASDLIAEVLGDAGRHTRIAVGASSLPANAAVEIDAIIIVKP